MVRRKALFKHGERLPTARLLALHDHQTKEYKTMTADTKRPRELRVAERLDGVAARTSEASLERFSPRLLRTALKRRATNFACVSEPIAFIRRQVLESFARMLSFYPRAIKCIQLKFHKGRVDAK